ncbi:MAG: DEAD/DEAH box helicase [Actinobacteria bacterium]|nr:DEAD/DEAH box helicase [Actinomycetota bacterium]
MARPGSEAAPADRHAASRDRALLGDFPELYPFGLDEFQRQGCLALARGHSVLVAAPTGAGKTVVGEFAVHEALRTGRKCFYTTPIKALSNQKFHDLAARYGQDRVGLLTGDNSINSEAPVVVMTTEVLRNMLYANSTTLDQLGFVVMDEVHYLADRFRGPVWEEVIIHLPEGVLLAALSATVSNAEEFGEWLGTVRGTTDVIVDEHRPVPLWQQVMVGERLLDLFVDEAHHRVNPELVRIAKESARWPEQRRRGRRPTRDRLTPWRTDVVTELHDDHLLPGITFIFSRAGCDAAVQQCLSAGLMLTSPEERREIESTVESRTADLPHEDLGVLGFDTWREGLRRGIAAHHAGLLPLFKEVVEDLFQRGLVKMVFATETLALGINMPARTVVLERLVKWNGENHVDITPGEYTQLTGRAGRRGIDVEGHAVVVWHPGLDPQTLAGLASTRTYPLRSSFRPSYNMAVSLIKRMGRTLARDILETSFAQFQADRGVVALAAQVRRNEEALEGYREAMQCHLGDFEEYAALRRQLSDVERGAAKARGHRDRQEIEESLRALRPGDVIAWPSGRRTSPAVVVAVDDAGLGAPPRITLVTLDRQVRRLGAGEVHAVLPVVGRLRVPKGFSARSATERKALAERLRGFSDDAASARPSRRARAEDADESGEIRRQLRQHPCHGCAEREAHARWAERYFRLARETQTLQRRVDSRTTSVARQFDRICDLLLETGYLAGPPQTPEVTDRGDLLAGIYSDADLLVAQAITEGLWEGLGPPELAAMAGAVVYEGRQREDSPRLPGGRVRESALALADLARELAEVESRFGVPVTRDLDLGFVWPVHAWAQGGRLATILADSEMAAGDFVRWCRQAIDLLDQIREAVPREHPLHANARRARDLIDRGIVSYSATA